MKNLKKVIYLTLAAFFIAATACDNNNTSSNNNNNNNNEDSKEVAEDRNEEKFDDTKIDDDVTFVTDAAESGMMEVKLGELAASNASTAEVKKFAATMVADHTKANAELKALAAKKNITLPADLSKEAQDKCDDLAKKKGYDFDKDYMDMMVSDHKDAVDDFEKEADKGKDPEIKAWANEKLTELRHHREMAEEMQKTLKDKKK